jgi:broad specificity phosphatase PhoE
MEGLRFSSLDTPASPDEPAGSGMAGLQELTLYALRHGECEHNVERVVAGQNDSPLTERGRRQAVANGKRLKRSAAKLDALAFYCSPLHRAVTTMELVLDAAALPVRGYTADRRLMELDCGENTWRAWHDIAEDAAKDPLWQKDSWSYRHPGGESLAMLHDRVGRFLQTLRRDAVIVAHAGTLRMIRAHVLGLSKEETMAYRPLNEGILRLAHGGENHLVD